MKKMRKVCSLIMVFTLALVLSLGNTAQAADSYTITINNSASGHIYEAYQVFTGDLNETGVLSNIEWGSGVNATNLLNALKEDATVGDRFSHCNYAEDVADAMSGMVNDSADVQIIAQIVGSHLTGNIGGTSSFENGSYTISSLAAGYYLVKDQNDSLNSEGDSYTRFMLEVVQNVTVTPKSDIPTVTKKVQDVNDSVENSITGWQDSADYDIGDTVPFQLTGTLPTNYEDYSTYAYIFHDKMSEGLTLDTDSIVVAVNGTEIAAEYYTIATTGLTDDCTFEVRFANLKVIDSISADSKITVTYSATLNENAVYGSDGNLNMASLEYSNNPNMGGEGSTGNTPDDTVIIFTYILQIEKVDQDDVPLSGAEFLLEKYDGEANIWKLVAQIQNVDGSLFSFYGLDDGLYRLSETMTPSGYNSIDPIEFTITANHEILADMPKLIDLSANSLDGTEAIFVGYTYDGSLNTLIVNRTGVTLPSTGGIGTTIFYLVGGVLMAGTTVRLLTKRKKNGHEN